jgi:hypothetical protein
VTSEIVTWAIEKLFTLNVGINNIHPFHMPRGGTRRAIYGTSGINIRIAISAIGRPFIEILNVLQHSQTNLLEIALAT